MDRPLAIFLYDYTGKAAEPFVENGWDAICVDLQHPQTYSDGSVTFIKCDAREWKPTADEVARCRFFAAWPPCDHVAVSGSRWFKGKGLRALAESIELFAVAAEWSEALGQPGFIENPVSTISTYWRKPDHYFNPFDYTQFEPGDNYTKKTSLWVFNDFVMPVPARDSSLGKPDDRIHKCAPSKDRANIRSATPLGFMRAVYESNFGVMEGRE